MVTANYKIMLRPEPEGGYTAIVPSLPGCITYGETIEAAKLMVREAIELYIESLTAENEPIPNDNDTIEFNLSIGA